MTHRFCSIALAVITCIVLNNIVVMYHEDTDEVILHDSSHTVIVLHYIGRLIGAIITGYSAYLLW